jgi:hypothetical protein
MCGMLEHGGSSTVILAFNMWDGRRFACVVSFASFPTSVFSDCIHQAPLPKLSHILEALRLAISAENYSSAG